MSLIYKNRGSYNNADLMCKIRVIIRSAVLMIKRRFFGKLFNLSSLWLFECVVTALKRDEIRSAKLAKLVARGLLLAQYINNSP